MSENALMATGLRERKKRRTRTTIQREAIRLFQEQGYEATTIEQIAAAAEISPSTFFNYFPNKEDVILTDEWDPVFVSTFLDRPAGEPFAESLKSIVSELMPLMMEQDRDLMLARGRLSLEVPELRSRIFDEFEKAQDVLRPVVAARTGRDPNDFELRVGVRMIVWAVEEAFMEWIRRGAGDDIVDLMNHALELVQNGVRFDRD